MTNYEREKQEWAKAAELLRDPYEAAYAAVDGFSCKNGCIMTERYDKAGDVITTQLANFAPLITKEVERDNGIDVEKEFTIEAEGSGGQRYESITIPARSFASMNWVLEKYGSRANICPGNSKRDQLRYAIQAASKPVHRTIYSHTGWRHVNGKWCYLYNGGSIGADGLSVELEGNLTSYALPDCSLQSPVGVSADFLSVGSLHITAPLMISMYLAPLLEFCKGDHPAFIPVVIGPTGTRKTTICALAMSHFGSFGNKQATASFADTANSIMRKGFIIKDAPILVDDYHPTTDYRSHETMKATAQRLARAYGDLAERGRANPDGTIRQANPPRGLCIMSGEEAPDIGESGMARYYIMEMSKSDIAPSDKLDMLQTKAREGYLWQAMRNYIEWLATQSGTLPERLQARFVERRSKAVGKLGGSHGRVIEAVAWLLTTLDVMESFFKQNGVTLPKARMEEAVYANAAKQTENMAGEKPIDMFLDALRELRTAKKVYISPNDEPVGELIGFAKGKSIYLLPVVSYTAISELYRAQGSRFPISKNELWKRMEKDGIISDCTLNGSKRVKRIDATYFDIPQGEVI